MTDPPASGLVARISPLSQWTLLVAISLAFAAVLEVAGLPAAMLLGPMIAGILVATNGGKIRTPRLPLLTSQTIIGCLIAHAITADILQAFLRDWPLFLAVVLVIVAISAAVGAMLSHLKVLPGTTAVWGTSPGAASAMLVMAGAFGADARLVAFMQYLRVVCVAAIASIVARWWVGPTLIGAPEITWFPAVPWGDFVMTLAIAVAGGGIGTILRIPAGALLVPAIVGIALERWGIVTIVLPPWLLAISYAMLGWSVGLGFTREILLHAWRALPQIALAIFNIIVACGGLALVLVHAAGIDPLTAYLATSPGGMDSIAVIAASSKVDLSFVMALQGARFLIVLISGPPLARLIARRMIRP